MPSCVGPPTRGLLLASLQPQVQRDFEELPGDAVESLRESLLQLLIRFSKCVYWTGFSEVYAMAIAPHERASGGS